MKSAAWQGSNPANKDLRALADDVIGKIQPGQQSHEDQLKAAKDRLILCPR